MVDGINFNGKVDIIKLGGTDTVNNNQNNVKLSTFGYGFQPNNGNFVRNVVPEELETKFANVNANAYTYISTNHDFIKQADYNTTGINSDKMLDAKEEMYSEV